MQYGFAIILRVLKKTLFFLKKGLTKGKSYGILVKYFALQPIGRVKMFEKDMKISFLLDFYGEILSERRRTVLEYYYNDDLSLSEIAQDIGISRQGVRDLIKKAEEELHFYEEKLGLAERFRNTQRCAERLLSLLESSGADGEVQRVAKELAETVRA